MDRHITVTAINGLSPGYRHTGDAMNRLLAIIMLTCVFCLSANADIWKYVDENGTPQYVDSNTPIYLVSVGFVILTPTETR